MGLLFGKKKPKPESKYDGNARRYDKEFKVYERIVHDDLRFDKNDTEREIQKRWIEYETRPNQFKWDYERVVEAERWLKVDEEGISTHPDRFTEGYMAETPEAYQKRMEYTEKIREHIKSVLNKEGDDPSLTPYERMFHRQYYAKARRAKKIADFTNQDYAIIRESIRDFYDYYKGENHCIITPNYVIEAWLLIAQHVFYDNEGVSDDIKFLSGNIGSLAMACRIASVWDDSKDNLSTMNETVHDENDNSFCPGFEFKILDPTDEEYKKQLEDYVQNTYGYDFRKFDTTFSLGTAKMIVNDAINNGIDRGFITYDIQEKELMKILKIRYDRKLTKEEFLELSDYGKDLVVKEAIRNNIGIMMYPEPVKFDLNKLRDDIELFARLDIQQKLHLTHTEMMKNIKTKDGIDVMKCDDGTSMGVSPFHWAFGLNYSGYRNEDKHLFEDRHFLYYYDKNNKAHKMNMFYKCEGNSKVIDDKSCDIISLKEIEYRFLLRRMTVGLPYLTKEDYKNYEEFGAGNFYKANPETGNVVTNIKYASYKSTKDKYKYLQTVDKDIRWLRETELGVDYREGGLGGLYSDEADKYGYWGKDAVCFSETVRSCIKDLGVSFSISDYIDDTDNYDRLISLRKTTERDFTNNELSIASEDEEHTL